MTEDLGQKLGIDWLKTIAGALAAVSSAVLLSTLGAAGTIIGAALGSVVVTVGGALYGQGLARSRARLAQVPLGPRRGGAAVADERPAPEPGPAPGPGWRDRLRTLPWKRLSLVAAGLFAAAVVAITVFELAAGRTLSSFTGGSDGGGGTTLTRLGGGSDGGRTPGDDRSPSDGASPTDGTTPPSEESSAQPTPTDEASPIAPASPTDRGSPWYAPPDEPTGSPSGSTSPTPTPATPTTPPPTLPSELTTTPPAG